MLTKPTGTKLMTGEILIEEGIITPEQLDFALKQQAQLRQNGTAIPIGRILLKNGFATKKQINYAASKSKNLNNADIPAGTKRKFQIFCHGISNDGAVQVSSLMPFSAERKVELMEELENAGIKADDIEEVPMDHKEILSNLQKDRCLEKEHLKKNIENINKDASDGQILQQVITGLLVDAIEGRASDIHMDKFTDEMDCWVSYRIDGVLRYKFLLTPEAIAALVVRFKTDSGLDISEARRPQDGRISFLYKDRKIDFRVATMPTIDGETLTIRILDPDTLEPISELFKNFPPVYKGLKSLTSFRSKSGGIILITGVTGSGKTTSMYGLLRGMNRQRFNILTVEDPVEFQLSCVRQTAVNAEIGLTFANILRAQLRHDPDVLVIGEMRDIETVETALRSAESGHLVISTLHTIDCKQAINRLLTMVSPNNKYSGLFVIANYIKAVVCQKLVRTLCDCAVSIKVSDIKSDFKGVIHKCGFNQSEKIVLSGGTYTAHEYQNCCVFAVEVCALGDEEKIRLPYPKGCNKCGGGGYHSRTLVAEAMFWPNDMELRHQMEQLLLSDKYESSKLMTFEKLEYHSLQEGVAQLLKKGIIDPLMAYDVLDLKGLRKSG